MKECYLPSCNAEAIHGVKIMLPMPKGVDDLPLVLNSCEQHEDEAAHYFACVTSALLGVPFRAIRCNGHTHLEKAPELVD